jgi:hypothetical protein
VASAIASLAELSRCGTLATVVVLDVAERADAEDRGPRRNIAPGPHEERKAIAVGAPIVLADTELGVHAGASFPQRVDDGVERPLRPSVRHDSERALERAALRFDVENASPQPQLDIRVGYEGGDEPVSDPLRRDGPLWHDETSDNGVDAGDLGELAPAQLPRPSPRHIREIPAGGGMRPGHLCDCVEVGPDVVRANHGVSMHEEAVVGFRDPREPDADELLDEWAEGQTARQYPPSRSQRAVAGVEEAQMDLPLVPPARSHEGSGGGVEEHDSDAPPGQEESGRAPHDPSAEDGDASCGHC